MNKHSLRKGSLFVISSLLAAMAIVPTISALDYEYWFDGQTQSRFSGTASAEGSFRLDIDAAELSPGLHSLTARVGDGKGTWSTTSAALFVRALGGAVGEAAECEYWIDGDTKNRKRTAIAGATSVLDFDGASLSPGLHTMSVRVGDGKGTWSTTSAALFVRSLGGAAGEAAECEYWIDGDTKNRKRAAIAGATSVLDIDAASLSAGVHSLSFCPISKEGQRGSVCSAYFVKPFANGKGRDKITACRWWLDNGPQMNTVELDNAPLPYDGVIAIDAKPARLTRENTMVLPGEGGMPRFGARTVFNVMFRDGNGSWGAVSTDTFAVRIPAAETDLTEFIANHDATGGKSGWKWTGSIGKLIQDGTHWSGEKRPYFCMGNPQDKGFTTTMTQSVDGLPAGVYVLSAYGRANTAVKMTMSVGDNSVDFPAGGEWNRRSLVFATDGTPFEIKVEGTTDQRLQWFDIADFNLALNCVGSLSVDFPADADMSLYKNMRLCLEGDGRQLTRVVSTTSGSYTFEGITARPDYVLRLVNSYGQTVACMQGVKADENTSVTLAGLKQLVNPVITARGSDGKPVDVAVEWKDSTGNVFATGDSLWRVPAGERMLCAIGLGSDAGRKYAEPQPMSVTADASAPLTEIKLVPLTQRKVAGEIYGDGKPLAGASVMVTEFVNGKYPNTLTARSGADGKVELAMIADSCRVNVMADGFADHSTDMAVGASLGRIDLEKAAGATVSFDISYSEATHNGPQESKLAIGLQDMNIVAKSLDGDTLQYVRQNGSLVLPGVAAGSKVELTLSSPDNVFATVTTTVDIDDSLNGLCKPALIEPGCVEARYLSSQNKTDAAILFDARGKKTAIGEYTAQAVSFAGLPAGSYTLVSMNDDLMRGNAPTLDALLSSALAEGTDYVSTSVNVNDGYLTEVSTGNIPRGSASISRLAPKSSFSSKKSTVTAGNFLTLIANIDFEETFAGEVSGLSLVVDLPDDVDYISNSTMVGNHINEARFAGGRLIVPIEDSEIGSQVKFCVSPLVGGKIAIAANLEFSLGGEMVTEALGTAGVEVENLKMTVPETITSEKFNVTGLAPARAEVLVTDGGMIIGQTTAQADGRWTAECTLANPFHLTEHLIMAKVTDAAGRRLTSDIHRAIYDMTDNEVEKVVMINTAHNSQSLNTCEYVTEFNFKEPENESPVYWYWPSYPTFTFKVVYADNSPDRVKRSEVNVKTTDGNSRKVNTIYDPASDSWVGSTDFRNAKSLPANVSVKSENSYDTSKPLSAELMSSVYAGILTSDHKSNIVNSAVKIVESVADNLVRFESEHDGKKASATMKFSSVDKIPDASTDGPNLVRLETLVEGAEPLTVLVDEEKDKIRIYSAYSTFEKISGPLDEIIDKYNGAKEDTEEIKEGVERVNDILKNRGVQLTEVDNFLSYLDFLDKVMDKASEMNNNFKNYYALIKRYEQLRNCEFVPDAYINSRIKDLKRSFDIYFKVNGVCSLSEWAGGKIKDPVIGGSVQVVSKAGILATNAGSWISKKAASNDLMAFEQACGISDGKNRNSGCADAQHVIDPSGYVYEAVTSNRLPGVTATVWQLRKDEDMYGDIHETPEKWDATAYSQHNPVITDDNGVYAWDVPVGEWQVRFEKEGYEPASTGWLPVPPPQLEINIGMTHAVAPDAVGAKAFESGVVVSFDKYMDPGSFSESSIRASVNGKKADGKIVPHNLETDPYTGRAFASEIKLAVGRSLAVGDSVDVVVGDKPRSYAAMEMQGQRRFRVAVLPEITGIAADSVVGIDTGTSALIPVSVSPASAAHGKWLRVRSASPSIIEPTGQQYHIDENGIALVEARALLPGSGVLHFTIDNYALEAVTRVDVAIVDENRVTMPASSVPSGSVIAPGTQIALSTTTPDAVIRYTLDGTCPCLEGSRLDYNGPIAISEDVVVKAQAFKDGLEPSEIAVFHYSIDNSGICSPDAAQLRVCVEDRNVVIEAPAGAAFSIYDTKGLTVDSGKMTASGKNIHIGLEGVYFVHIATSSGYKKTFKIVIL